MSITDKVGEQSRTKVSSEIDRITRFPTQGCTDSKNQEKQREGDQIARSQIGVVLDGENDKDQDGARDDLGKELSGFGEEGLGVGTKDPGGRRVTVTRDRTDGGTTFVGVDGRLVVPVDDGRTAETSRHLGAGVYGELPPREPSVDTIDHGYGGVQVTSGATCDIDPQHHTYTPTTHEGKKKVSVCLL